VFRMSDLKAPLLSMVINLDLTNHDKTRSTPLLRHRTTRVSRTCSSMTTTTTNAPLSPAPTRSPCQRYHATRAVHMASRAGAARSLRLTCPTTRRTTVTYVRRVGGCHVRLIKHTQQKVMWQSTHHILQVLVPKDTVRPSTSCAA